MTDIDIQLDYLTAAQARASEIATEIAGGSRLTSFSDASVCGAPSMTSAVSSLLSSVDHALQDNGAATTTVSYNLALSAKDYTTTDENESGNMLHLVAALTKRAAVS